MCYVYLSLMTLILFSRNHVSISSEQYCTNREECSDPRKNLYKTRYIFYDVNYPEGFNLRRDVYMRLAIFLHLLKSKGYDWHLVLPPWHHLYHWKSVEIGKQNFIPWSAFFDIESMKRFAPVMDFEQFLHEVKGFDKLDNVFYLKHYKNAFSDPNWDWSDKWELDDCDSKVACLGSNCEDYSYRYDDNVYRGWFWGYRNMSTSSLKCVSFQGPASLLAEVLDSDLSFRYIMVDHAEVVLHDTFGDGLYWKCRRSMRFAENLRKEADSFRFRFLGSNDTTDRTNRPRKWENEKVGRKAFGGPYVCAHLRRGDFLYGRSNQVPSLEYAADQLKAILKYNKLETVFITTDSTAQEVEDLQKFLSPSKLVQYKPNLEIKNQLKDGGVAIVDQIICSYARYFIGTHESTFTFRIQEEREIISFPTQTTFNLFCATPQKCFESSKWTIVI